MALDRDPNHVFRDFVTDGIPSSGNWNPRKPEIRQLLTEWWQTLIALVADAGGLELPNLLIRYEVTGGDENNIIAEANLPVPSGPGVAVFSIVIEEANTGPVTINGKPLLSNTGNPLAAGALAADGIYLFLDNGDSYRLLSDYVSSSIVAAAEAAAAIASGAAGQAVDAADRAESAAAGVESPVSFAPQTLTPEQQEQARENIGAISTLNSIVTFTVGPGGDYATINSALEAITTKFSPAYTFGGRTASSTYSPGNFSVQIMLLSGFTMEEQVFVTRFDAGWIIILAEDEIVPVARDALTELAYFDNEYPLFYAGDNAVLPTIGALFSMDDSGSGAGRHGIVINRSSSGLILPNCGVINAGGHGLYVREASRADARLGVFSGAAQDGFIFADCSYGDIHGGTADNVGRYGVHATGASSVYASGMSVKNAGTAGVRALDASRISCTSAVATGGGNFGLRAQAGSVISAYGANARRGESDSPSDISVSGGSIIHATEAIGGVSVPINVWGTSGCIVQGN